MDRKRLLRNPLLWIVAVLLLYFAFSTIFDSDRGYTQVPTSQAIAQINAGNVKEANLEDKEQQLKLSLTNKIDVDGQQVDQVITPYPSDATRAIIERNGAAIDRLARLESIRFETAPTGPAMQIGAGDATLVLPLEGVIDIAAEKARLEKALAAAQKEAKSLEGRLSNPSFVERAKPEAVEKAKADHALHSAEAERLAAALARLG